MPTKNLELVMIKQINLILSTGTGLKLIKDETGKRFECQWFVQNLMNEICLECRQVIDFEADLAMSHAQNCFMITN